MKKARLKLWDIQRVKWCFDFQAHKSADVRRKWVENFSRVTTRRYWAERLTKHISLLICGTLVPGATRKMPLYQYMESVSLLAGVDLNILLKAIPSETMTVNVTLVVLTYILYHYYLSSKKARWIGKTSSSSLALTESGYGPSSPSLSLSSHCSVFTTGFIVLDEFYSSSRSWRNHLRTTCAHSCGANTPKSSTDGEKFPMVWTLLLQRAWQLLLGVHIKRTTEVWWEQHVCSTHTDSVCQSAQCLAKRSSKSKYNHFQMGHTAKNKL